MQVGDQVARLGLLPGDVVDRYAETVQSPRLRRSRALLLCESGVEVVDHEIAKNQSIKGAGYP